MTAPTVRVTLSDIRSPRLEPIDQHYGVGDCSFRDPAGNLVRFSQPSNG